MSTQLETIVFELESGSSETSSLEVTKEYVEQVERNDNYMYIRWSGGIEKAKRFILRFDEVDRAAYVYVDDEQNDLFKIWSINEKGVLNKIRGFMRFSTEKELELIDEYRHSQDVIADERFGSVFEIDATSPTQYFREEWDFKLEFWQEDGTFTKSS